MSAATTLRSTPARMLRNIRFNAVAQAYSAAVNFAVPMLVAHIGVDEIPVYGVGFVLWTSFRMVSDLGVDTLCVRDVAQRPERLLLYQTAQIRLRRLAAAASFAVMVAIALAGYDLRREAPVIALFGLTMLLETLALGYRWSFRATQRMGRDAAVQVIERTATLALVALAVFGPKTILACAAAFAAAQAVNLAMAFANSRFLLRDAPARADAELTRYLMRWGPTFMGMAASFQLYQALDFLILQKWPAMSQAEAGLYFLAFRVYKGAQMLPELVMQSTFPALAELHRADGSRLRATIRTIFRFLVGAALSVTVVGVAAHRLVARVLLLLAPDAKAHVHELSALVSVLMLTIPLYAVTSITGHILAATGRQVRLSAWYLVALLFNVAGNVLYAIPRHGAMGCAVMSVLTEAGLQTALSLNLPDGLTRLVLPRSLLVSALVGAVAVLYIFLVR